MNMPMKNCSFVDDWFAIPTSKYSHGEPSVAMFKNRGVAMSLGAWPAPQKEPSIQSCNGPTPMINAHFKPSLGVLWMTHFWNVAFSRCSPKKTVKIWQVPKENNGSSTFHPSKFQALGGRMFFLQHQKSLQHCRDFLRFIGTATVVAGASCDSDTWGRIQLG